MVQPAAKVFERAGFFVFKRENIQKLSFKKGEWLRRVVKKKERRQ